MRISPVKPGDDIFLQILPHTSFEYKIFIPDYNPSGLYWFHAHYHPYVERQVFSGLSGAIIVEGLLNPWPYLVSAASNRTLTENIVILKDIQLLKNGSIPWQGNTINSNASTYRTINGQISPSYTIQQNELQFWRVANIGADIYYNLTFTYFEPLLDDGNQQQQQKQIEKYLTIYQIAKDGNTRTRMIESQSVLLYPGSRYEFFIRCPSFPSPSLASSSPSVRSGVDPKVVININTERYSTGPVGDLYPHVVLGKIFVSGISHNYLPVPTSGFPESRDLRKYTIAQKRTFFLTEDPPKDAIQNFYINGKVYNKSRIDVVSKLNTVEKWSIINLSNEQHVFHIHQTGFQLVAREGMEVEFLGREDTVNVKEQAEGVPGSIDILISFLEPVETGEFVFHCHILGHEDQGMMQNIRVV